MNRYSYGSHVSKYHGSTTTCRFVHGMYVLNFKSFPFKTYLLGRFYNARKVQSTVESFNFVNALKIHFKTKDICSVVCKNDTNSILVGNSRVVIPMPFEPTPSIDSFRLYLTPYYVNDPQLVSGHLRGMALPAYDNVFPYKNCILYLDEHDIPVPGGCYFDPIVPDSHPLYRLCILTAEPEESVIQIASEWQARRGIQTLPFITKDVIRNPAMISFQPIREIHFSDQNILSSNTIHKYHSLSKPHCLIQDILSSYFRHQVRSKPSRTTVDCLNNVGLILEWPLRITYEGSKSFEAAEKKYVALAVNGYRPTRVLHVRHPYERYIEYDYVPATLWTPISYVQTILETPADVQKVSIRSTVIGYEYGNAFFCFAVPVLEGTPSPYEWRNIRCMLSHATNILLNDRRIRVMETYRWNKKYYLNHVQMTGVSLDAWCLTKVDDHNTVYLTHQNDGSTLLEEWLQLVRLYKDAKAVKVVDTEFIRLALLLTRHKICFQTKITEKVGKNKDAIMLNDDDITLFVGEDESKFLNDIRVESTVLQEKEGSCIVM